MTQNGEPNLFQLYAAIGHLYTESRQAEAVAIQTQLAVDRHRYIIQELADALNLACETADMQDSAVYDRVRDALSLVPDDLDPNNMTDTDDLNPNNMTDTTTQEEAAS